MLKTAVIVAGGSGTRMASAIPKQFLVVNQKPVLIHSIKAFLDAYADMEIILVLPADYLDEGKTLVKQYFKNPPVKFTTGGVTRFQSVKKGLELVPRPSVIFVHDAVRCLVSISLIRRCYEQALQSGSAIPAIRPRDSIRMIMDNKSVPLDRNRLRLVQTPQTFQSEILIPAFDQQEDPKFTDEATVVESAGVAVHLVEGEETNIKITLPIDLELAELFLSAKTV